MAGNYGLNDVWQLPCMDALSWVVPWCSLPLTQSVKMWTCGIRRNKWYFSWPFPHACTLDHVHKRMFPTRSHGLWCFWIVWSFFFISPLTGFSPRLYSPLDLQNTEQRKCWWGVRGAICSPDWMCVLLILINLRNRRREKSWCRCLCTLAN